MAIPVVAAFWATFSAIMVPLAYRLLAGLGIGMVTYSGLRELLDMALEGIQTSIGGMGANVLQWVALFNVDRYFMIVFSAMTVRMVFQGLQATGLVQKMVFRGQLSLPV